MLKVTEATCGYGRRSVLHEVSIQVGNDECVCLLGENGTGKSTLLKLVIGLVDSTKGSISHNGVDITLWSSSKRIKTGIAYVPQHNIVFPDMSVRENMLLGVADLPRSTRREALERGFDIFPRLREISGRSAGVLSGGEQKMVAVGRAIAFGPRLLVCDEPSAGLSPLYVQIMYEALNKVRESGIAILLAEQNVSAALRFADRAYVLDRGRVVIEETTSVLRSDDAFRTGYLLGEAFVRYSGETLSNGI